MSEKTHKATPKRRRDARKKGQVLKSQEIVSAIMLLGLISVLKFWFPSVVEKMQLVFLQASRVSYEWTIPSVSSFMISLVFIVAQILAPLFIAGTVIAIGVNYIQVRSLFTIEPLKPQINRLSPISGAKRMFGIRAWVQLAKALFKIIAIGYFLYAAIRDNFDIFPALQQLDPIQSAALVCDIIVSVAWKISLAFLAISVLDFIYQWWEYEKNLKMSHQEIKEEFKQTEGNPQIKSEIKRKQRAMSMARMMEALKTADVVVTNPTHYAVALKYDPKEFSAPYVVAKGADYIAQRLKQVAKEYDIVTVENKPLARALYDQTEIGQTVPADLYKAVAEVLAFVYRLKRKKPPMQK